jgi:hypothetical protein
MADEKLSFPNMPVKHWWALRERFKRSLPSTVTPDYLETALNINQGSALPLMSPLKIMGLIDADGKTNDRTERWRHDDTYPEVCAEIRKSVYPDELRHAVPDPAADRSAAERWFAKKLKVGERVSQKLAAIYELVTDADPNRAPENSSTSNTQRLGKVEKRAAPPRKIDKAEATAAERGDVQIKQSERDVVREKTATSRNPSLHIDIQIHISSDATNQQIDQIFASMAKHLYNS